MKDKDTQKEHTDIVQIGGVLRDVSVRESDWNGQTIKKWQFRLEDNVGVYVLQIGYGSNVGAMVLNSLASLENFGDELLFSVGFTKSKNGKKYGKITVYNETQGKVQSWQYASFPKKNAVYNGNGDFLYNDEAEFLAFFDRVLQDIQSVLHKETFLPQMQEKPALGLPGTSSVSEAEKSLFSEEHDDIPF